MHASRPDDGAEVFDFLDEYLRDREAGRARPLSEYLARHHGHEEAIAREWVALQREERGGDAHAAAEEDERRVGPWRLVRELGRGGQGAVWLAEDTRIERRAALKLLPESFALLDGDRRRRLRREAEALARLDHAGICPVLEAEVEGGTPYIAMRLIEGESLAALVHRARERPADASAAASAPLALPPRRREELAAVLAFFEQAARALHAAHEAGLVHRDVKPGNVMVTPDGRPVLLDFGQARDETASLDARTLTGETMGTPAYMSPEQIRGRSAGVDRRTDVWSLGAALYEALTLERPFEGASIAELLVAIGTSPLPAVRERNAAVPRDLAVVLETALEKDAARRYTSALDLAEDLRRVREHEPIRARPAGPGLRLSRWVRRHPVIASSLAIVLLSLSAGLASTLNLLARERRALEWALGSHLAKRTLALIEEDPAAALALGIEAVEMAPNHETRGALLAALDACWLERLLDGDPARRLLDLDLHPDGRTVAAALDDGAVRLFDLASGKRLYDLRAGEGAVNAVRFLGSGRLLLAAGEDGGLQRWDLRSRALVRGTPDFGSAVLALATDAGEERLAVATRSGTVAILSIADGRELARVDTDGAPDELRFTTDGRRLLAFQRGLPSETGAPGTSASLIDTEAGVVVRRLGDPAETLTWAAFDASGERVVSASREGTVRFWSARDGALLTVPLRVAGPVWCVEPSADGQTLALGCEQGEPARAWLWNLASGERMPLPGSEQGRVVHVSFSPDGRRLATASFDAVIRLYDAGNGGLRSASRTFTLPLENVWTADSRRLLTLGNAGTAAVWMAGGRRDVYTLVGHRAAVTGAWLSRDGERALTTSLDGTARLWSAPALDRLEPADPRAGEPIAVLGGEPGRVRGARFTPDGRRALTWDEGRTLRVWDACTGQPARAPLELDVATRDVDVSPDGTQVVALGRDGAVRLLALEGNAPALELPGIADAVVARFSPDGSRIAVGTRLGAVHCFDQRGGSVGAIEWPPALGIDACVDGLVFHPSGDRLAVIRADSRVHFLGLDGQYAEVRAPLVAFPALAIDWSLDGNRLLVVGTEGRGAVRLQDLERDAQVRPQVFHAGNLTSGEFSPDGTLVLTGSLDGTVYVRSAHDGTPVAHLKGHASAVLHASFGRDSGPLRVISASADGTARVWPVDPLPPALARKPRELQEWERAREQRLALPLRYE